MDHQVPALEDSVSITDNGKDRFVPDIVGRTANRYQDALRGKSHLSEISRAKDRVSYLKQDCSDIFDNAGSFTHGLMFIIVSIVAAFCFTVAALDGGVSWTQAVIYFFVGQIIHLMIAGPIYGTIYAWRKKRLADAEKRLAVLESQGLVRTEYEQTIVNNPWSQFASHAATLREHFNKKARQWNITATGIEKGVLQMTDQLRQYHDHLVSVRQQIEHMVNTAEFLVMHHESREREGDGLTHHEMTELLSQIDDARDRMDAVFEIEELPFDPAEVTQSAKVVVPEEAPVVDTKRLVQQALAARTMAR